MKILHLTLKKKWFDMIASGEKTEEYRELKPYWGQRFCSHWCKAEKVKCDPPFKRFDVIRFQNGYAKDAPTFDIELKEIEINIGIEKWGAVPHVRYFVLKLGQVIKQRYSK